MWQIKSQLWLQVLNLHILQWYYSFLIQLQPFPTTWMNIFIWIHMTDVSIWSIIFSWLLSFDIFHVEFTWALGHGTQAYNGGWTTSTWWISFLHGTLVLQSSSALWSIIIHGTLVYGCTSSVEDNAFIRGMECKVDREVVGRPKGPIVIIVEVIQCKVD